MLFKRKANKKTVIVGKNYSLVLDEKNNYADAFREILVRIIEIENRVNNIDKRGRNG